MNILNFWCRHRWELGPNSVMNNIRVSLIPEPLTLDWREESNIRIYNSLKRCSWPREKCQCLYSCPCPCLASVTMSMLKSVYTCPCPFHVIFVKWQIFNEKLCCYWIHDCPGVGFVWHQKRLKYSHSEIRIKDLQSNESFSYIGGRSM
jgi:hypothetical protein